MFIKELEIQFKDGSEDARITIGLEDTVSVKETWVTVESSNKDYHFSVDTIKSMVMHSRY